MAAPIVLREALEAFDVYLAGETDDGTFLYSRDPRTPIDDTVVWVGNKSDDLMTVLEAEDRFNEVYWRMEPELVVPATRVAAFGEPAAPVDIIQPQEEIENEAIQDERLGLVEEAETRVGELEAMVADLMLGSLTDLAFDVGETDMEIEIEEAKVASLGKARSTIGDVASFCARVAALEATPDEDIDARLQTVLDRLEALEEKLAELLGEAFDDDALPGEERDSTANTVDETEPKVAAAAEIGAYGGGGAGYFGGGARDGSSGLALGGVTSAFADGLISADEMREMLRPSEPIQESPTLNDLLRLRRGEEVVIHGTTYQALGVGMFRSPDGDVPASRLVD